jgi:hypothetical protein
VESVVASYAGDSIMEISNLFDSRNGEEKIQQIISEMKNLGKISWVRDLILEEAYDIYNWHKRSADIERNIIDDLESHKKNASQ